MSESFKIKIYLPSLEKYVYVKQFCNSDYKSLLKHIANKNAETFNLYINDFIKEHCDTDVNELNIIDKFIILLNLRCVSIGDSLVHTIQKDVSKYNLKYNIYDVIKNVVENGNIKTDKIIKYNQYSIKMCIPKNLFVDIQQPSNFIQTIAINNKLYDLSLLNEENKIEAVNSLPGNILFELYDEIQNITTTINKIELTKFKADVESNTLHTLYMYLDKDNMFSIMGIFFNELLTNLFIKQFILSKEYHISCEYFDSLPPIESEILYNFHKEIEQRMSDENKRNNSGPNIPGIPAGGMVD